MEASIINKNLRIGGMTCINCQNKIEKKLTATEGIKEARVNYNNGTAAISYDEGIISLQDITAIIRVLGYEVLGDKKPVPTPLRAAGILIIIVALYLLLQQAGFTAVLGAFPTAESGMGYGMLFVIGLLTSVHCIAMCGGINLSQCIPQAQNTTGSRVDSLLPSFMYNFGRVASYTVIGGAVGALGAAISLTGGFRGAVQLIAGVFMVIMGLNMLGLFPWLRKLTPRMPLIFARKINAEKGRSKSPLYVGLLNGFMPCGPLQAMQLYALSTGSPVKGALAMLIFSLGTVPLMFGLGTLSSLLSKKFTRKVMTVGAVLVIALGLSMFTQGWVLSNLAPPSPAPARSTEVQNPAPQNTQTPNAASQNEETPSEKPTLNVTIEDGVQLVRTTLARGYQPITVVAGIPVKWTIDAPRGSITGCNGAMMIPEYGIECQFQNGENVIEFVPEKAGKFTYTCWMAMIRSSITVVEDNGETDIVYTYLDNPDSGETPDNGEAPLTEETPAAEEANPLFFV